MRLVKMRLTENQAKVFKDKYLRGARSVPERLWEVAAYVARAEGRGARSWAQRFYDVLSRFDFLPNSPALMNAARPLGQLSACYVIPIGDSLPEIMEALTAASLIQQSGGGTGFSFSRLRPAGDPVKLTRGVASGAVSFMTLFDKMTDVIKQGGTRRGANMGILHYTHPQIREFIALKSKPGVMENFNLSVSVDSAFIRALDSSADYALISPRTGRPQGRANAREIFDSILENALQTGDPGLINLDAINDSASNPVPGLGRIEATNPCGEQPLLPWEPCTLGSINLSNFVTMKGDRGWGVGDRKPSPIPHPPSPASWDFPRLREAVHTAVRFLDDCVEINNYPLSQIEKMAKGNRRIGLGVMGWAEALVKLGIPYDSEEALEEAEKIMSWITREARAASDELAKERGAFPNWKGSIYDPKSPHFRGANLKLRNAALTTIAPTGTIAIAAGLEGSGIEPFFALSYTRYGAGALASLQEGESPGEREVFDEFNPLLLEIARKNRFFGLGRDGLQALIRDNRGSAKGLARLPEAVSRLFPTAHDILPEFHVRMQAAFQKHVDNGVSKTVNLPREAGLKEAREVYRTALRLGLKGITLYRDGSKAQVLNVSNSEGKACAVPATGRDPSHVDCDCS